MHIEYRICFCSFSSTQPLTTVSTSGFWGMVYRDATRLQHVYITIKFGRKFGCVTSSVASLGNVFSCLLNAHTDSIPSCVEWFHSSMTLFRCHRELEREVPSLHTTLGVPELFFFQFPTVMGCLQACSFAPPFWLLIVTCYHLQSWCFVLVPLLTAQKFCCTTSHLCLHAFPVAHAYPTTSGVLQYLHNHKILLL